MLDGRSLSLVTVAIAVIAGAGGVGCAGTQAPAVRSETSDTSVSVPQKTLAQRAVSRVEDVTGTLPGLSGGDDAPEDKDPAHGVAVPIPGSPFVKGRATVTVAASIDTVREAVLGFGHYAEFMPHYKSSKLLGRTATGARDVYMQIEALHGAITLWAHIEVAKASMIDGVETYPTKFIEGNVKDFQAVWRLKSLGDKQTELSLEVYLQPTVSLPADLQNEENVTGAAKGVLAMKTRAESR